MVDRIQSGGPYKVVWPSDLSHPGHIYINKGSRDHILAKQIHTFRTLGIIT